YRVVWGDTLSGIAEYFNISVEELAIRYHIINPNFILAGVTLEDQHLFTVLDYSVLPSETIQDTSFNFVQATKKYNTSAVSNVVVSSSAAAKSTISLSSEKVVSSAAASSAATLSS